MKRKVKCPVCTRQVDSVELIFDKGCNVVAKGPKRRSLRPKLTAQHDAVSGCAVTEVRSERTGKVVRTMCAGSLRPVKKL